MVCSAIAREAGEKLFEAVCKKEDPDIEKELKPLLQAYKNAPTKDSENSNSEYLCKQLSCQEAHRNAQIV